MLLSVCFFESHQVVYEDCNNRAMMMVRSVIPMRHPEEASLVPSSEASRPRQVHEHSAVDLRTFLDAKIINVPEMDDRRLWSKHMLRQCLAKPSTLSRSASEAEAIFRADKCWQTQDV